MAVSQILLFAMVLGASGRLSQPTDSQQLAAGEANPQVDSWHDAEKARIEAECDAMMRKLWAQKRQKLQDLVDAARKRVEDEMARLRAAQARAQAELDELNRAKAAIRDVPKVDLGPTKDAIADQEAKVAELCRLIAEKSACLDELHQAQAELEEALRRLACAERRLREAEASVSQQKATIAKEESDIAPAQADVDAAEAELARATSRHEAAEKRLSKAKGDLSEHDSSSYSAVADGAAPSKDGAPSSSPGSTRSGAQGAVGPAVVAMLVSGLLF